MEIHHQTCQQCGSRKMSNLIVREDGHNDEVYVRCLGCRSLVARYIIAQYGYYHHGKGYESYLRGLNRGGYVDSGKDTRAQFEKVKEECETEFEAVLKRLEERGDDENSPDEV